MAKVTPHLMVDLLKSFPQEERGAAERDLTVLMRPPYRDVNYKLQLRDLPEPAGLLDYAVRFGSAASVGILLEAGADPDAGKPRPLTLLTMAQICRDEGRIEKIEALLKAEARADYVELAAQIPPTPLIALARSKITGIQRYWIAHALRAAGASTHTANDYELRVVGRLLAELRGIDAIMTHLTADEQAATKRPPSSFDSLVAAVLHSENPAALRQMVMVKKELKVPLDFDPTAALDALVLRIADNPVVRPQADFIRVLIGAGAVMQGADATSAFEQAVRFENHELVEIFIEAGAKPDLASSPDMVFELMRRQGLPQQPKIRPPEPGPMPQKALTSLDLLCSGIDGLETCPEADLDRLTADHVAAMQSLAKRLHAVANRLAPFDRTSPYRRRWSDVTLSSSPSETRPNNDPGG